MGTKTSSVQEDGTPGDGKFCIRIYSRRAALINELCLNKQESDALDVKAVEALLRETPVLQHFTATADSVIGDDGSADPLCTTD